MFLNHIDVTKYCTVWLSAIGVAILFTACNSGVVNNSQPVTPVITSYSINGTNAIITGNKILIQLPPETDVTHLVASFTSNTDNVVANGTQQISGLTSNDFTKKVTYTLGGNKKQADSTSAISIPSATVYSVAVNYGTLSNSVVSSNIHYDCNGYTGPIYVYLTGATSLIGQKVSLMNTTRISTPEGADYAGDTIYTYSYAVVTVDNNGNAQALAFAKNSASVAELIGCSTPVSVQLINGATYADGAPDMYEYPANVSNVPYTSGVAPLPVKPGLPPIITIDE